MVSNQYNNKFYRTKIFCTKSNTSWLIIFADLLSLILSFLILIYINYEPENLNQKKWQAVASSLRMSFNLKSYSHFDGSVKFKGTNDLTGGNSTSYNYIKYILLYKMSLVPSLLKYELVTTNNGIVMILNNLEQLENNTNLQDLEKLITIFNSLLNHNISFIVNNNRPISMEKYQYIDFIYQYILKEIRGRGLNLDFDQIYIKDAASKQQYFGVLFR